MANATTLARAERAKTRLGEVLNDKWRLDELLGVGGMASVFAATHRNGNRAAIKMLHPELLTNPGLVKRFLREGYAANKLGHPGAVSIADDHRADDGLVYLVMELLEGYSLDRHTRRGAEPMPLEQVLTIAEEVLEVLAAAHAHGVIHRDIKPANLFLQTDGHTKVLDFGIARLAEPLHTPSGSLGGVIALTQTGTAIGTPAYMPPEQARGRWNLIDVRTDLWSLGATMYAILGGERPRRADTMQEELLQAMTEPLVSLAKFAPTVPPAIVEFVDRAVSFEKEDRWPDARTMQEALRVLIDSGAGRWTISSQMRLAASRTAETVPPPPPKAEELADNTFTSTPDANRRPRTKRLRARNVAGVAAVVAGLAFAGSLAISGPSAHSPVAAMPAHPSTTALPHAALSPSLQQARQR